jgi:hypothetical protein
LISIDFYLFKFCSGLSLPGSTVAWNLVKKLQSSPTAAVVIATGEKVID